MDAIVLVGGQGTRLRPLSLTRHKSLVPVCNRPAIAYLFEWLARSGFDRAVLAIGRDNDDLAEAYPPGRAHGIEITVVHETSRLESGGAIRNAVQTAGVEGRFVVLNGDVFVDFDFAAALRAHAEKQADLTLALYPVSDPSSFGVAVVDDESMVTGFVEKPPRGTAPGNLVNAGVWIFEPGLVAEIPTGPVRVEETLFPSLVARRRRVFGYRFDGTWADIGTPARYLSLNRELALRAGGNCIGENVSVDASARLSASSLGAGCVVGPGAVVRESILWEGVTIGAGASVDACILADGVSVGAGARLSGVVAGKGATIGEAASVPPGTSLEPGGRYDGRDD
ncbi:MAG: NDP-sugar synthase [Chloroflexi bacterium]|nr:NDP-sugar synthase [Chloroflexota bacterium]